MALWRIVTVTYELAPGPTPQASGSWVLVVRHEFYGPTPERAFAVYQAHLKSDKFLRDCQSGHFGEVVCTTAISAPERLA